MNPNGNYGLDTLTVDRVKDTLYSGPCPVNYWGPVIEKNGKYYITVLKDDADQMELFNAQFDPNYDENEIANKYYNVGLVVDKSMSQDELDKIIYNYDFNHDINDKSTNENIDTISEYIKEVESKTGMEVGCIDVSKQDQATLYDINGNDVVHDIKISENTDPNANTKFNIDDVTNVLGEVESTSASEKLNENNKAIIENYIKNNSSYDDAMIVLDDKGKYIVVGISKSIVDGKEEVTKEIITYLEGDITLSSAMAQVSGSLSSSSDSPQLKAGDSSYRTQLIMDKKLKETVYIDVPTFESVNQKLRLAGESIEQAQTSYTTSFTEKLLTVYNELVDESNPVETLSNTTELIDALIKNINYSLGAYDKIDNHLAIILDSIISEIFEINSVKNKKEAKQYGTTYEERSTYLDNMIDSLSTRLNEIEEEFQKIYPNGEKSFDANSQIPGLILGIENAFNLSSNGYNVSENGNFLIPVETLMTTTEFIKENDLITVLSNYSNGNAKSWYESGLADVYYKRFKDEDKYMSNPYSLAYEYTFLNKYINYSVDGGVGYTEYSQEQIKIIKGNIKEQLNELNSTKELVYDEETGEQRNVSGIDLLDHYSSESKTYQDLINTVRYQRDNYEKYRNIMPFEAEMNGDLYLEYLTQNYDDMDLFETCPDLLGKIQYMSQSEIALYCMYHGVKLKNPVNSDLNYQPNQEKAKDYLNAMDDIINQRHGLEDAVVRIAQYEEWIKNGGVGGLGAFFKSGIDGFGDGLDGFFSGIVNVFANDGKQSSSDYRNMYMFSLLTGGDQSNYKFDIPDAYRTILKENYTILKSVGTQAIPTLAAFVPGIGSYLSPALTALSSFGNSVEGARQGGASASQAYLYGGISALSDVVLNKLMSGIKGLNGQIGPTNGILDFTKNMLKQGVRTMTGTYVDAVWRNVILGQPIDLSSVTADGLHSILTGFATAALMNGTTNVMFKLADGVVFNLSDTYNSYQDYLADKKFNFYDTKLGQRILKAKEDFKNSELYQKIRISKFLGGTEWEKQQNRYKDTLVEEWIKEDISIDSDDVSDMLDLTDQASHVLNNKKDDGNFKLKDNQRLLFDPKTNKYLIFNEMSKNITAIPKNLISNDEGMMHLKLDPEHVVTLRLKEFEINQKNINNVYDEITKRKTNLESLEGVDYDFENEKYNAIIQGYKLYDPNKEKEALGGKTLSINHIFGDLDTCEAQIYSKTFWVDNKKVYYVAKNLMNENPTLTFEQAVSIVMKENNIKVDDQAKIKATNIIKSYEDKIEYETGRSRGGYSESGSFYHDQVTGKNNYTSEEYEADRMSEYRKGSADEGNVGLASYYTNRNANFLGKTENDDSIDAALGKLAIGEKVKIKEGPDDVTSFGLVGDKQYVGSKSQFESVRDVIKTSTNEEFGNVIKDIIGVPQVPDRVLEVTLDVPEAALGHGHEDYTMSNEFFMSGGLPVKTLPNKTKISMYEGVIDSIDFSSDTFKSSSGDYNLRFNNYDIKTGALKQSGTFVVEDGELYLLRTD